MRRKLILGVVGLLAAIQLVRPERTNPPERQAAPGPPEVAAILKRACFDCHSNETRWPGYSNVAPPSWLVANHVAEARRKMNFSTIRPDRLPFDEICERMQSGEMPMSSYTLIHRDAKVSKAEIKTVCGWAEKAAGE